MRYHVITFPIYTRSNVESKINLYDFTWKTSLFDLIIVEYLV